MKGVIKEWGISEGKIEVIPPAINLEEFKPVWSRGETRKRLRLEGDEAVILTIAKLDEHRKRIWLE